MRALPPGPLPRRALTGGFALPGYGLLWRATRRLVHSALVRVPVALRGVADVPADLLGCVGCALADVLGGVGCVRADVLRCRGDLVRSLGRGVGRPLGDALGRRLGRAALADRLLSGTPLAGLDGLALLGRLVRGALLSGLLVPGVARLHCSSSSLVDVGPSYGYTHRPNPQPRPWLDTAAVELPFDDVGDGPGVVLLH